MHLPILKNSLQLLYYLEHLVSNPNQLHYRQENTKSFSFAFTFDGHVMRSKVFWWYDMYETKQCL